MEYNPASFVAPELPEMGPRYPDWVLLATRAYISDRQNATVAHGQTSDGAPIQVSLFAADPPAVSHLRVHCPGRENQFSYNPAVLFSRDDLILFDVSFGDEGSEFFIYKAHSKNPSLHQIPEPEAHTSSFCNTGLVRCSADHFAVAVLSPELKTMYKLSVFSSRTGVWTTRLVPLQPSESTPKPEELRFTPTKVIPLKGSLLGWVDLGRCILLCDVLSDDPKVRYIPLPEPMPGNVGCLHKGETSFFRDVCGCEDLIKCIEMDYRDDGAAPTNADGYTPDEWTAVIRIRMLDWSDWERAHVVDIADITVAEPFHGCSDLLPELCENGKPSLKKMPIGIPTLCEYNSVFYLMSKLRYEDSKGWVVAVDAESKRLEAVAKFSAADSHAFVTSYYPSSFSKHLNDTTGGFFFC
ncbi:uncharacterized protein LOC133926057 isoform X2 [Phragmites australis]|uniref:uncharacterized protein LOC133926057 isoform X2 n=1 Tax=Phragmites australis TaxID=29695 RepID=UPI002D77CA1E|nr:uncharacterized protein LOC133926057 isoform X2 [Phragmites australis]